MYDPKDSVHQAHPHLGRLRGVLAKIGRMGEDTSDPCHPKVTLTGQGALADAAAANRTAVVQETRKRAPCLVADGAKLFAKMGVDSKAHPDEDKKEHDFLKAKHFAVVGASDTETKWGCKVMKSLLAKNLDVIPINPVSCSDDDDELSHN